MFHRSCRNGWQRYAVTRVCDDWPGQKGTDLFIALADRKINLSPFTLIVMRFVQAFSWLHFARTHNLDTQVAFWIHAAIA